MIQVALEAMLDPPVIRDDIAAKAEGVVVAWMASQSGSRPERQKDEGGKRALHGSLHFFSNRSTRVGGRSTSFNVDEAPVRAAERFGGSVPVAGADRAQRARAQRSAVLELGLAGGLQMIQIALQAVLNQLVVGDDLAAKLFGIVVTGVAGESGSRPKRQKHCDGDRALQGNLHH